MIKIEIEAGGIFPFKIFKDDEEIEWEELDRKEMTEVYSSLSYQQEFCRELFKSAVVQLKKL